MKTRPFLGEATATFAEAFPHIGSFTITVDQGDAVWGEAAPGYRSAFFNENYPPPPVIGCTNRRCHQGGLRFEALIPWSGSELPYDYENKFPCNGHEGSPKGRRIGARCMNTFRLKMHFERKA
ncbi:MAG TPA: hypothetical protein VGM17_08765 [Rhizomicrobium sp.]|jgi:hypothetical protein